VLRTDFFHFGPESALLDQIEIISFDGADSETNVLVSLLLDVGTFVKRLFLYCFDITSKEMIVCST
jgi:hypothetical protein